MITAAAPDIAIIGAGPAGLATALALQQQGYRPRVYEKTLDFAATGVGFLLQGAGLSALSRLGLGRAVAALGQPVSATNYFDPGGRLRLRRNFEEHRGIRRQALIALLRDALPVDAVVLGQEMVTVRASAEGPVHCELAGGDTVRADFVIGADGVHSQLRQSLFGPRELRPSGVYELICELRIPVLAAALSKAALKMTHPDGGLAVGAFCAGADQVIWYLQVALDRHPIDPGATAAEQARVLIGDWAAPVPDLLAQTDFSRSRWWQSHSAPPPPRWHRGRCLLLGDAVHPMFTATTQGVNGALEDALALAEVLGPAAQFKAQSWEARCAQLAQTRNPVLAAYRQHGDERLAEFLAPRTVWSSVDESI